MIESLAIAALVQDQWQFTSLSMAQVRPELPNHEVSGRTVGTVGTQGTTSSGRRRSSLTRQISMIVAKTQTGAYTLEVDPLMPLVIFSGVVLAGCAGMVNAIAFETAETLVSHVTGTVSKVSLHAVGEHADAGKMVLIVTFFVSGSMISGCMIKKSAVKMAYMGYGLAMTSSSLLLVLSLILFNASKDVAVYLLCVACGLQNGIMSSYTGSVIRTTHMTGIVTDIGLIVGRHISGFVKRRCCRRIHFADEEPGEVRKLVLLLLLLLSFLIGVAAGSGLAQALHEISLLVPAIIAFLAGSGYMLWTYLRDDIQEEVKLLREAMEAPTSPTSPTAEPLKAKQDGPDSPQAEGKECQPFAPEVSDLKPEAPPEGP
ncbi:unnamed protein product [Durusdinium trenchii]|uniref:H(+)-exporting diphosphatase n=1 Tax=Durusdinium trenchii TaxID=1381693 RepID=A0ABP0KPA2_9DINO